jgi:hypothetical protein
MTDEPKAPAGGGQAIDDTWSRLRDQEGSNDETAAGGLGGRGGMIDDPVRRGTIEDDIPQPALSDDDIPGDDDDLDDEDYEEDDQDSLPGDDGISMPGDGPDLPDPMPERGGMLR